MKKTIITILVFLTTFNLFAQNTSSKDAKLIKGMKLIIALEEYGKKASKQEMQMIDSINAMYKKHMNELWKYSEIADVMPLGEAENFVKKNKKTHCYIHLGRDITTNFKSGGTRYISYGNLLTINAPSRLAGVVLPYFDGNMDEGSIVYGIMQLQYILNLLEEEKVDNVMEIRKYVRKNNSAKVIKKTLLIPKEYLSPKISIDDIKAVYPYDMEICSNEKIERAILTRDPKYAIVFYVPTEAGTGTLHLLYISSTEDGEIYGFDAKGNVSINGIAVNPKGKYVINKGELKVIGGMVD